MKKIRLFFGMMLVLAGLNTIAADTLYVRFNNYWITDGPTADTIVFDVEIRSSTVGTYLFAFQTDISYNTTTFGSNALPIGITTLEMVGPAMTTAFGPTNPSSSQFRYSKSQLLPPYDPSSLTLVPSSTWGKLVRYKMLVINNSQALGLAFITTAAGMGGDQKFVKVYTSTGSTYAPIVAVNSLQEFPSTPTNVSDYNLMISEVADPNDSNADFVEIYNPGPNNVNFATSPWYLTQYNGTIYQNVPLTGILNAGATYVVGGEAYAPAYPGKTLNKSASFIQAGGTVSYFLSIFGPYNAGATRDVYNGTTLPFTGKHAVRPYALTAPNTAFTASEWTATTAATMDVTPGSHRKTLTWDGTSDSDFSDTANWTRPYVPDVGHNVEIPLDVQFAPVIPVGINARVHNLNVDAGTPAK